MQRISGVCSVREVTSLVTACVMKQCAHHDDMWFDGSCTMIRCNVTELCAVEEGDPFLAVIVVKQCLHVFKVDNLSIMCYGRGLY